MADRLFDADFIAAENAARAPALEADYAALGASLGRRGIEIEAITARVADFGVAIPSWGVGTGGTRFARFPGPGEPRDIWEKLDDCAAIQALAALDAARLAAHPWDRVEDPAALAERGRALGLGFDAMNSNTFSDQPGPAALLQVRLAVATPTPRCAPRRSRTISSASRSARRSAPGADGLDRRRLELPRPDALHPRLRPLPRLRCARSTPRSPTTGGCSPSTRSTSRRSTPR